LLNPSGGARARSVKRAQERGEKLFDLGKIGKAAFLLLLNRSRSTTRLYGFAMDFALLRVYCSLVLVLADVSWDAKRGSQ
jgi:hypothetical protein